MLVLSPARVTITCQRYEEVFLLSPTTTVKRALVEWNLSFPYHMLLSFVKDSVLRSGLHVKAGKLRFDRENGPGSYFSG